MSFNFKLDHIKSIEKCYSGSAKEYGGNLVALRFHKNVELDNQSIGNRQWSISISFKLTKKIPSSQHSGMFPRDIAPTADPSRHTCKQTIHFFYTYP